MHLFCVAEKMIFKCHLETLCSTGTLFFVGGPGFGSECWHIGVENRFET